jgi:hypothetical protein
MALLGGIIAVGSAVVFLAVGALTLFGAVQATWRQVLPGFAPDQPAPTRRALTLLALWLPALLVAALCLLAGIQIFRVGIGAML